MFNTKFNLPYIVIKEHDVWNGHGRQRIHFKERYASVIHNVFKSLFDPDPVFRIYKVQYESHTREHTRKIKVIYATKNDL